MSKIKYIVDNISYESIEDMERANKDYNLLEVTAYNDSKNIRRFIKGLKG